MVIITMMVMAMVMVTEDDAEDDCRWCYDGRLNVDLRTDDVATMPAYPSLDQHEGLDMT